MRPRAMDPTPAPAASMRPFNFSAGPAALPLEVLEQAREELLDWNGSGMSVMEISHRSAAFMAMAERGRGGSARAAGRAGLYRVLFMQGGASAQFALVPMNLATAASSVDYIDTGHWSKKAIEEARRYCTVRVAARRRRRRIRACRRSASSIWTPMRPTCTTPRTRPSAAWSSATSPRPRRAAGRRHVLEHPVAADRRGASSALIYAGAQKNIGPAGLTVVIVREDLHRPGAARDALGVRLSGGGRRSIRCSIRRRPSPGTWRGWCSNG